MFLNYNLTQCVYWGVGGKAMTTEQTYNMTIKIHRYDIQN